MTRDRGTKIVATIGPASSSRNVVRRLVREGVDVFRLNFSHGTHDGHQDAITKIRQEAQRAHRHVGVLADLQGPKIRTGEVAGGEPIRLKEGADLILTTRRVLGTPERVSTGYRRLPREVARGDRILLDDGRLALRVKSVEGSEIRTAVELGGELGSNKGLSVPGVRLSAGALTRKDRLDLEFAVASGVDYVALSFVRSHRDLGRLKRALSRHGAELPVIAKIERPEAVADLPAILDVTDGVMIARGDLGVELAPERVPILQKEIVDAAERSGVPVITATQMLESMMISPRPTRAEATDVANAVLDGTDAVMLSGETAAGKYPVRTVQLMDAIIREAESSEYYEKRESRAIAGDATGTNVKALCRAAVAAQREAGAKAVIVFTASGNTARILSKLRPGVPVFALSASEHTLRRTALYWGVEGLLLPFGRSTDEMVLGAQTAVRERTRFRSGDPIVMIAGSLPHEGGANMMKLCRLP